MSSDLLCLGGKEEGEAKCTGGPTFHISSDRHVRVKGSLGASAGDIVTLYAEATLF